jgi:lipoprotein-anchoring transpeptidase ErfK/SrfK
MLAILPYLKRALIAPVAMACSACHLMIPVDSPEETVRKAKPSAVVKTTNPAPSLYEWKGTALAGPVAVRIDLSEQKANFTRGGQPAGWTYVATGTRQYPTPTGAFSVREKVQDKTSTSWGQTVNADGKVVNSNARNGRSPIPRGGRFVGAPMPFWMRVHGAIGMHAGPIPNPGSPASHGCIRMPRDMAEILFGVAKIGTPVIIVP